MLYTPSLPADQGDRVRLYPSPAAARAEAGSDRPIFGVAVRLESRQRRVVPLWPLSPAFDVDIDPTWATPAQIHADGSVTARAPIPRPLFVG
ncbi:MAG TPA: hypothetical protein VF590_21005 [Isosphaeraceae bacterium]|jgi:hypothetical protein